MGQILHIWLCEDFILTLQTLCFYELLLNQEGVPSILLTFLGSNALWLPSLHFRVERRSDWFSEQVMLLLLHGQRGVILLQHQHALVPGNGLATVHRAWRVFFIFVLIVLLLTMFQSFYPLALVGWQARSHPLAPCRASDPATFSLCRDFDLAFLRLRR